MCNQGSEHNHYHHPEIVQIMPVHKDLYAVYKAETPVEHSVLNSASGLSLVPVIFLGLIKHGEKTMVEGFFASFTINSCENIEGFKGYASSLAEAEKLYS